MQIQAGQFAKFQDCWGQVITVGHTFAFLAGWGDGHLNMTVPLSQITEVRDDQRKVVWSVRKDRRIAS